MKSFKAGYYIKQGTYKSFQPEKINRKWSIDNMELLQLLSQADRQLGRLDMYSEYIPNISMFISMHVLKEATQSSKIEGTKTNIEEALLEKEDILIEKRDDWQEVQNYIAALNSAIESLEKIPFSSRLIKETHKILLQGVRGKHKSPGEFRTSQNWIGGASINDAIFIPPVHTSINELMNDLEKFVHNDDSFFPELLKIALIHYQFETIHPFLDGNGRVGRLMITLYLVEKGILKKPILYLSDFFERNRNLYYDNLTRVREKDDILQWYKFFLVGINETALKGIATFDSILKLQKEVDLKIQRLGSRSNNATVLLNYLYQHPLVDAQKAKEITQLSMPSVYKLLDELEKLEIVKEITGSKRGKLYSFSEYIKLFY
ncbi:MAG: Fic family protein [Sphingobacteriales bacterium]|jgi:Fic family protein|nr:MAG: Fic family protein [Sphingobacteriales bacterium]